MFFMLVKVPHLKPGFFTWLLGLISICLLALPIQSAALESGEHRAVNTYEIEIPAILPPATPKANTNLTAAETQNLLIQQAFKALVLKQSGSSKSLETAAIKKAVSTVDNYVEQFSYVQRGEERRLKVRFDAIAMNDLFKEARVSPLENRPLVLLWWVVGDQQHSEWVKKETEQELTNLLEKLAQDRNLPLFFPLFDLTDTAAVTEQMVINKEMEALSLAAKRYAPQMIWIGHLNKQPSGWHGQWTLVNANANANINVIANANAEPAALSSNKTWDLSPPI